MKTLYDLIGAHPDDDAECLKKAYRNAVKLHHPDHHAGDPEAVERLMEITAAYELLRDARLRRAYDLTLKNRSERPRPRLPLAAPATIQVTAPAALKAAAPAASEVAAPPRRMRLFMSSKGLGAAATMLMLSGAVLLVARSSGVSLADVIGGRAPQTEAAAVPAPPRMVTVVVTPHAPTSPPHDRSVPAATGDRILSPVTTNGMASRETGSTADTAAVQPTVAPMPIIVVAEAEETRDGPSSTIDGPEPQNTAASVATTDGSQPQETVVAEGGEATDGDKPDVDMDRPGAPTAPQQPGAVPAPAPLADQDAQQAPVAACKRWQVTTTFADGSTLQQCVDNVPRPTVRTSKKAASRSGDRNSDRSSDSSARRSPPAPAAPAVESKPSGFNLGPLCLSTDPGACPTGDGQRR